MREEEKFISRFKNTVEYVELYLEDIVLLKRRKANVRLLGLLLFHTYLHNCDGDVILLIEINELERKLERLELTPYVRQEIERMLKEKRIDYEASKNSKNFLSGLIEFENLIDKYKEPQNILYHAEQLIKKLQKFNPKFEPEHYIDMYLYRQECPKNPLVINDYDNMSKTPRKRLQKPKKKPNVYDYSRYEQQL